MTLGLGEPRTYAGDQEQEQCLDPVACPILYLRLSKQETEPFLFDGKLIDENHPRYDFYHEALPRFPDVRACLTEAESEKTRPDLRQIDWERIDKPTEMDVCLFRIFSSIEDVAEIRKWLRFHGFRLGEHVSSKPPNFTPHYPTQPVTSLAAYLTPEQYRRIIPRAWLAKLIGYEGLRGFTLTVSFSKNGELVGVSSGGGTIFN